MSATRPDLQSVPNPEQESEVESELDPELELHQEQEQEQEKKREEGQEQERDAEGQLLCTAALWGQKCRYMQRTGCCGFSHAVPAELAAEYAERRAEQRAEEKAKRDLARVNAQRVIPPTPQPAWVEAARTHLVLDCASALDATLMIDRIKRLLECSETEELAQLHQRGPGLGASSPVPMCPTLMYALRLGGFKLPATWVAAMQRGRQHIARLHASQEYKAFLAAYDEFVKRVVLPAVGDPAGVYYQRPPTLRVAMPSRKPTIGVHCDAEYPGHHPAEVNFWVPLVDVSDSLALWLESKPGLGDFSAVALCVGAALRFNGSLCRHHTVPNVSGRTRVSFDLRAVPASAVTGSEGVQRIGDYAAAFMAA